LHIYTSMEHSRAVNEITDEAPPSNDSKNRLFNLPWELVLDVVVDLSLRDLNHLAQTCRFAFISLNPSLYRRDSRREKGNFAILWGAKTGCISTVQKALEYGADVNAQADSFFLLFTSQPLVRRPASRIKLYHDIEGKDALTLAAENDDKELVRLLLHQPGISVDCTIVHGHVSVVEMLLGCNHIDSTHYMYDRTRLFFLAALWGQTKIVRLLLGCKDVDVGARSQAGLTALHLAAIRGQAATIEALLEHEQTNRLARDTNGHTALHWALENQDKSSGKALLSHARPGLCEWFHNGLYT
jgi:ankyrin repeat protein